MVNHCCYGTCKSDTRYPEKSDYVKCLPFPKPKTDLNKTLAWIEACVLALNKLTMEKDTSVIKYSERYSQKLILAPMVRISVLPTRLLALDYGADLVYSEEIIDYKLLSCRRIVNDVLNTVDFVAPDDIVLFQTCPRERSKVVLQLGTSDGQRALRAARIVENDVSGIDVNMGCPKRFSIVGGMGAALLTKPDKIKEILTTLVQGLSIPVTCKMRVLPTVEATIEVAQVIQSTGVVALTIHGRTSSERTAERNRDEFIKAVSDVLTIPVIANGGAADIQCYSDLATFKQATNASSVMVARSAQKNPSIFSPLGKQPTSVVITQLIKYSVLYDLSHHLCKYCIQSILYDCLESELGVATLHSYSLHNIAKVWGLDEFYVDTMSKRRLKLQLAADLDCGTKRQRLEVLAEGDVVRLHMNYVSRDYLDNVSPKQTLNQWARQNYKSPPSYATTVVCDRRFSCVISFESLKFSSSLWGKSKQVAEQSSAMVCLQHLGIKWGCPHKSNNDSGSVISNDTQEIVNVSQS